MIFASGIGIISKKSDCVWDEHRTQLKGGKNLDQAFLRTTEMVSVFFVNTCIFVEWNKIFTGNKTWLISLMRVKWASARCGVFTNGEIQPGKLQRGLDR